MAQGLACNGAGSSAFRQSVMSTLPQQTSPTEWGVNDIPPLQDVPANPDLSAPSDTMIQAGVRGGNTAALQPAGTGGLMTLATPSIPGTGGNMLPLTAPNSSAQNGQFHVSNGQIIGPNGQTFIARGINVFPGQVDAATILNTLPGVNSVRLAATLGTDPAVIDQMVQGLTSKGGVVLIEDHSSSGANGGDNVLTGQALANETTWYAGLAAKYKNNPGVWFGTANEPDNPSDLASIAAQEGAIYDAIRGTGNNSMVALEMRGGFTNDFAAQNPGVYANMKNVAWDTHVYGWTSNYSTDPSAIFSALGNQVANAQSVKSADGIVPTLVGEYGPSTTGLGGTDANGTQVVGQVLQSNLGGFAWAWNAGSDALTNGSGQLTSFGQQVAGAYAASK